ncbi:hypothetical protein DFS34DRAFT_689442 [Phlyctochytrium arcticum]|nr:hypothetical protein DFS34DRAFT_689442 [Phlyctochytrium arcticum]
MRTAAMNITGGSAGPTSTYKSYETLVETCRARVLRGLGAEFATGAGGNQNTPLGEGRVGRGEERGEDSRRRVVPGGRATLGGEDEESSSSSGESDEEVYRASRQRGHARGGLTGLGADISRVSSAAAAEEDDSERGPDADWSSISDDQQDLHLPLENDEDDNIPSFRTDLNTVVPQLLISNPAQSKPRTNKHKPTTSNHPPASQSNLDTQFSHALNQSAMLVEIQADFIRRRMAASDPSDPSSAHNNDSDVLQILLAMVRERVGADPASPAQGQDTNGGVVQPAAEAPLDAATRQLIEQLRQELREESYSLGLAGEGGETGGEDRTDERAARFEQFMPRKTPIFGWKQQHV